MVKQKVPDIRFKWFTVGEILDLFANGNIFINEEYQRGSIWKDKQKVELIESISNSYSIGVLVLTKDSKNRYEIMDGQQRLLSIKDYLDGELDEKLGLSKTKLTPYEELSKGEKNLIDAYCVYYLELKSFGDDTREEDITQTFLRLQEGTKLNKAEIINAYRGQFKDTFVKIRKEHPLFKEMTGEKRFRFRQLAAEFLLLELKSDTKKRKFPSLELETFEKALDEYREEVSKKSIKNLKGNLDILYNSLNIMLSAIGPRELIPFYLLVRHLRENKADNSNIINELEAFFEDFLKKIYSFGFNVSEKPEGLTETEFKKYLDYKIKGRSATSAESVESRFDFVLSEFKLKQPYLQKDQKRLYDIEQKRGLYFLQKGICPVCDNKIDFRYHTAHHLLKHSLQGSTVDLGNGVLLHEKCHEKIEKNEKLAEKLIKKIKQPTTD